MLSKLCNIDTNSLLSYEYLQQKHNALKFTLPSPSWDNIFGRGYAMFYLVSNAIELMTLDTLVVMRCHGSNDFPSELENSSTSSSTSLKILVSIIWNFPKPNSFRMVREACLFSFSNSSFFLSIIPGKRNKLWWNGDSRKRRASYYYVGGVPPFLSSAFHRPVSPSRDSHT